MTPSLMHDENWRTLLGCLPPDYEELALKHKQLLTQYGNAKVKDADTLLRFIFLHAGADLPLRQTVMLMAEAGGPRLSPMRLHSNPSASDGRGSSGGRWWRHSVGRAKAQPRSARLAG